MKTKIRQDYPPANHMLRDLGISFTFEGKDRAVIRAPVVPEVCSAQGTVRIGVLATLVDVLGGILSARVLQPDWMATASLSLHTGSTVSDGYISAAGWAAGIPMPTRDLVVNYLSPGRVGPFETRARVIRYDDNGAITRVEVIDTGAQDRLMAVAMNTGLSA